MFGFIASPVAKLVAAVLFAAAMLGVAYYKGYAAEHEKFVAYKAEIKAAVIAQEESTRRTIATQQQITKKAEERHAKDISTLRAVYGRMRQSASSGSVPAIPDAATDPAQATAYYLDVAPELAIQCGETTQQMISLQDWARELDEQKKTGVQ